MDTIGFMNYLLYLGGENREYLSDIPMLQKLEEKNAINLDDYIPYNEDYKKTLELETLLSKESNGIYFYRPIRKYMDSTALNLFLVSASSSPLS